MAMTSPAAILTQRFRARLSPLPSWEMTRARPLGTSRSTAPATAAAAPPWTMTISSQPPMFSKPIAVLLSPSPAYAPAPRSHRAGHRHLGGRPAPPAARLTLRRLDQSEPAPVDMSNEGAFNRSLDIGVLLRSQAISGSVHRSGTHPSVQFSLTSQSRERDPTFRKFLCRSWLEQNPI